MKNVLKSKMFWMGVAQIAYGIIQIVGYATGAGFGTTVDAYTWIGTGLATVGLRRFTEQAVRFFPTGK